MKLHVSADVRRKLANKHHVQVKEVHECFENRCGKDLFDMRARHRTDPLTRWFLAPTNHRRLLKIVFVPTPYGIEVKTAYAPNPEEIRIWNKYGLPKKG